MMLAYQVHTGLQAVLGNKCADGMINNMGTVLAFGTADPATIGLFGVGKAEVSRTSYSNRENQSSQVSYGEHGHSSDSSGTQVSSSTALQEREVVDAQLFASLMNTMRRGVPIKEQRAGVVCRTTQGDARVLDVIAVYPYDPPPVNA